MFYYVCHYRFHLHRAGADDNNLCLNIIYICLRGPFPMFYYARISKHNRMRRDINIDKAVRRNQDIITNGNVADDSRIYSYPYSASNCWRPHISPTICLTDDNPFVDIAIIAQTCFTIDCYVIGMSYIQAPPDLSDGTDFQSPTICP